MKYRKKPVVIDAIQYIETKDNPLNGFLKLCNDYHGIVQMEFPFNFSTDGFTIKTLEGKIHVSHGDYVIRGVENEFYPCRSDIFNKTYESVE